MNLVFDVMMVMPQFNIVSKHITISRNLLGSVEEGCNWFTSGGWVMLSWPS